MDEQTKMETQTQEQKQLGEMIQKLLANMKKDSATRKTQEYLESRTKTLKQYWDEFQQTHAELLNKLAKEHNYLKQGFYEQVEQTYKEALKHIKECQQQLTTGQVIQEKPQQTGNPTTTTPGSGNKTNREERLLQRQQIELQLLNKAMDNILLNINQIQNYGQCEYEIKNLSEQWKDITSLHKEILVNKEGLTGTDVTINMYERAEEEFKALIRQLHEKLNNLTTNNNNQSNQDNNSHVALPRITLPVFEGNYEKWTTFHDIFVQIIHKNSKLGDAEKMQYLKTHITGEASKLIQHLEASNANYETAWNMLINRYNNQRILFTKFLDNILNLPTLTYESAASIKRLHDTTTESLRAISNMGVDTTTWGPFIAVVINKKLDRETNKLYEQSLNNPRNIQDLDELMDFLEKRFQSLEALGGSQPKAESFKQSKPVEIWKRKWPIRSYHANITECGYCRGNHTIIQCEKFKALNINERSNYAKRQGLCNNCLTHKDNGKCYSQRRCIKCNRWHHTLLHFETKNYERGNTWEKPKDNGKAAAQAMKTNEQPKQEKITSHVAKMNNQSGQLEALLATAYVKIQAAQGNYELLRALVDPGSQASFITENAAQLLALPRMKTQTEIAGLGRSEAGTVRGKIWVEIGPRFSSNFKMQGELLILPKLTHTLPRRPLDENEVQPWKQCILADPTYDTPGPIDVLIGVDLYKEIILEGMKKSTSGILAQRTELGWILSGTLKAANPSTTSIISMVANIKEDEQLTKFWDMEEVQTPTSFLSEQDKQCEEQYKNTYQRNTDGTYTIQIPFKEDPSSLGESKKRAVARLLQLEKRLDTNEQLGKDYKKFMEEYIDLDHMKLAEPLPTSKQIYYIPHQAVIKEDSETTKLRVVFDASSKTTSLKSLNDIMYTGPRLQQDLFDILLRWRKYPIVLTADIEKMYRQIKLHPSHQQFHRILWRFSKAEPIQEYQLTTVTYGTAAAPYLAIRTVQQLAEDEKQNYPRAYQITLRDFYVDDLLTGVETVEEAQQIQAELTAMMKAGGFNLRKWVTNIVTETTEEEGAIQLGEKNESKKTLGVHWSPRQDTLTYRVKTTQEKKTTKRIILSEIAKIFDPLGLLAPIIIKAKLLMQELWVGQYPWDKVVPAEIYAKWTKFQEELPALERITIPRWIKYNKQQKVELHGFCDASEKAYGAVLYTKTISPDGTVNINILTAKSKVAPIKMKKTLPKLELCAASLLAKMVTRANSTLGIEKMTIYTWTDSMIVLAWIKGGPEKWKNFVANRVADIRNQIGEKCWNHVKSEDNPADLVSRGIEPSKLESNSLWWNGPSWLQQKNTEELLAQKKPLEANTDEEKRTTKSIAATTTTKENMKLIERFSSLRRMIRVIAYCRRFIMKCKKQETNHSFLTAEELQNSLQQIIRSVQKSELNTDIKSIEKNGHVQNNSPLLSLQPFMDKDGILRVGGRIQHSTLSYNEKHPIIINHGSHLGKLIITDAHKQTLHGGNQQTLAYARRKFWILRAKIATRQVVNNCTTCARYKAVVAQQIMGELPPPRVTPSIPFTHTGIDYAGPIQIRMSKGRGHKSYKGYIAIFVCLSTKAIHIEAVSDMTSNAFIAAFRRFTSRRGKCAHIYSDNGTTFIGANKVLEAERKKEMELTGIEEAIAAEGIQWHFIPPASPHFGGLWEAGVKSIKHHLKRVIGEQTLTFEELSTLLYQIEACLNSRPLAPLSNDPNDVTAITPGHFLIGQAINTPPDAVDSTIPRDHISMWNTIQKLKKDFWKIWSTEYLSRLQQRSKWRTAQPNIAKGDIVLIKEENISPNSWPLARVIEIHPGGDGLVRVVTVQTKGRTILKRPVTKVCPLPNTKPTEVEPEETRPTRGQKGRPRLQNFLVGLTIMCSLISTGQGNYTITTQAPGMYVEHLGYAKINRGVFRLGVNFSMSNIPIDKQGIHQTMEQISKLCNEAKKLTEGTHCDELIHHLTEQQQQIQWNMDNIQDITNRRSKRGLLGNLLTSVFGVNDEVYRDIDSLDKNQHQLIEASNHQAKLMLATMTTVKETETRVNAKLENFRIKFNQGLSAINEMRAWFRVTDINKINIYLLTTYEMASNYLQEISQKYNKLLDACFHRGHLFEFVSPSAVINITNSISKKLPSNMVILASPMYKMDIIQDPEYIQIFGYFHITEVNKYNVVKVTSIPRRLIGNTFVSMDLSSQFLAIDYNNQKYFEIPSDKFENSIPLMDNTYLCTPTIVSNIQTNPNCVIEELYHLTEKPSCRTTQLTIATIVWKELQMVNTWLFVASKPTRAAIICNSIREDVLLNNTGIIQISPVCVIATKQHTLQSKTFQNIPVLATYAKPMSVNINTTLERIHTKVQAVQLEPVLHSSDKITDLQSEEMMVLQKLDTAQWNHRHTRSTIISTSTSFIVIIICFVVYLLWKSRSARSRIGESSDPASQPMVGIPSQTSQSTPQGDFNLETIYSEPGRNV